MRELRLKTRVPENKSVQWQLKDGTLNGRARVHNISETGMLMETNSDFVPVQDAVFLIDSQLGYTNYFPFEGRLIWSRPLPSSKRKYHCGVQFTKTTDFILPRLREQVSKKAVTTKQMTVVQKVCEAVFTLAVICILGFVLWLSAQVYQSLNQSSQRMFVAADKQAALTRNYANLY